MRPLAQRLPALPFCVEYILPQHVLNYMPNPKPTIFLMRYCCSFVLPVFKLLLIFL